MKTMTRREFMRGMAAGAAGVAAVSVLGGCSSSSSTASSSAAATTAAATTAAAGETTAAASGTDYGPEVTFIFSNVTTQCSKDAGQKFKDLLEEKSGGMMKIDLYQDNILGDDQTATENTQIGDIQIVVTAASPLVSTYPDYYVYDCPYLFPSRDDAINIGIFSEIGKELWGGENFTAKSGLLGKSVWENGFRNLTNSVREVTCVADCKGLKLRTQDNDVHLAAWKALGANPSPMAFSELYTALQQKTMDGQENPFAIIVSNKFYEIQPYITKTEHVYAPHMLLVNPDAYNALTDAQKQLFDECLDEATTYQYDDAAELESSAVADCEAGGAKVTELTAEAKAEFQQTILDAKIMDMVKEKMEHPEYMDQMLEAMNA